MFSHVFVDKNLLIKTSSILFIFLPVSLISGPFISDLSISLIALFFLFYCYKEKNFSFFKNNFFYFLLLFWLYLVLNSLFINFNLDSLKISFFYIRFYIFVIACIYIIERNVTVVKFFYYSLFLCFSILIIDGYCQQLLGFNLFGIDKFHPDRISSFFGDELILGSYIARLSPLFFGLSIIFLKNSNIKFLFFFVAFILLNILIIFSGERTSFFLFNLIIFFMIIFLKNFDGYRFKIFLVIIFSVFALIFSLKDIQKRTFELSVEQIKPMISGKSNYYFSVMHTDHYNTAFKMFKDNKLFGVGIKNFRKYCSDPKYSSGDYSCSTHPHNMVIQILSELGIVGFLFYFYIIFFVFKKFVINILLNSNNLINRYSDYKIVIFTGLIITLFPFIPSGNIFNNWLNIFYWIYVPFLFAKGNLKPSF